MAPLRLKSKTPIALTRHTELASSPRSSAPPPGPHGHLTAARRRFHALAEVFIGAVIILAASAMPSSVRRPAAPGVGRQIGRLRRDHSRL